MLQTSVQPKAAITRNALAVDGITHTVKGRDGRKLTILDGVDLAIGEGEFVSIVGTSGCGKSTLLNLASGLLKPAGGSVSVFGDRLSGIDRRIGYMFQVDALLPWRTVRDNVGMGMELAGVSRAERNERTTAILAELGLAGFGDHYPSELSGGMRQRASLARTWVTNPEIILMDEPFGALDSQTRLLIQDSFLAFWEKYRKTVVLVTHDLGEAIAMSDRVVVMSARPGRVKTIIPIELPRPRRLEEAHREPRYNEYWQMLWQHLKEEAAQAMQGI